MQNVGFFVEACKEMGVPVIFLPDDLVYTKNMNNVFVTLEHLEKMVSLSFTFSK